MRLFKLSRYLPAIALFLSAAAIALPAAAVSQSQELIRNVVIRGNQRIEAQTISSYLGINEQSGFTQNDIDKALKNLFATGFFSDVNIYQRGADLVVEVVENPVINRVAFEGNSKVEKKDLENEVELKPRAIYTRTKIQNDVKRILDIYRRGGRYSATVEPKVIPLEQNRVDLVFEIQEGPVAYVKKIVFIGNEQFDSADLEKAIRTERKRWYRFFGDNDKYDPDRLSYDQELLRRYYVSRGYADFQVKSATAELTEAKDGFIVTFSVEEGKRYDFGKIDVNSSLSAAQTPDFSGLIKTKTGAEYNADLVEDTVDAMVKELGNSGFAFVDIDPQLHRNADSNTVDITYNVKEGPRVYVERINITGNVRTLDEVVRREFRLAEGDPYSTSKLARSEQRLNNLGFFEKVKITNEPGSAPDKAVINVDVQEKSTGEITLGAGFSTSDGALADVGIRETNFLGRGQDIKFNTVFAARRQQYDIGFTEPYFLDRELSAGFDLFKTRQDLQTESSFEREVNGFGLRMGYALTEKLQHTVNYTLRQTDINNVLSTASRFIKQQEGTTTNSAVGQSFIYDDRNNKFEPTSGYYWRLNQELAGVGGNTNYIRHEVKAGYYYPIIPKWTLSFLGSAGHIQGLGEDVRIQDRFFIGGDIIRGFDNAGLGPRDTITKDALGGNTYYAATTELRFPLGLPEELGFTGAAFVDAGSLLNVDETGPEVLDDHSLRVSAGVGIAWSSPFGPIRVDIARPIVDEPIDITQLFRLNFGTRF